MGTALAGACPLWSYLLADFEPPDFAGFFAFFLAIFVSMKGMNPSYITVPYTRSDG